jgi:hypothetical protein
VVANHDALGDVEPEAGTMTDGLGGEEGVEDARLEIGGDPGPVVADLDAHAPSPPGRAQGDASTAAERVGRVVDHAPRAATGRGES